MLKVDETKIDQPILDTSSWKVLFEDKFDDGIGEDWQRLTGDWTVVDGAACGSLQLVSGGVPTCGRLEREIPGLSHTYEVQYATWTSDPTVAACFLRRASEDALPIGHRVALASFPDRELAQRNYPSTGVSLMTCWGWNRGDVWVPQLNSEIEVRPNQHVKVCIIRQAQRITVFIDGKQILSERVRNIETGSIRFFARGEEGTKMFVDNFKVKAPSEVQPPK